MDEDFEIIPIEQISHSSSLAQEKLNRLKRETFWIDTLDTLEPRGLNKKRYEDMLNLFKTRKWYLSQYHFQRLLT